MIYNFNLGIGWASSGVEYAQAYRARAFRNIGADAKFIFTDMFSRDNIEHMTKNIGFLDSEVIWLYTFFTDIETAPVKYTLARLENSFGGRKYKKTREGDKVRYVFEGEGNFYVAYMVDETSDYVHRVEMVSGGLLIRKDYYTYCKVYSEYYAPLDNRAHMYSRRFFNRDGSVAYEEINDDNNVIYRFPDKVLYSKEEFVAYMVQSLKLTKNDVVIIDRTTGIGQAIIQNAAPARIGVIIHADHFSEGPSDSDNILWNNYYEYAFSQNRHIDFFVAATDAQNSLLRQQFRHYNNADIDVVTIPVGSIDRLRKPEQGRKPHSLITASRLADEKHVDWLIDAVVLARKAVPDITLDIYGKGGCEVDLKKQIEKCGCSGYVRLCGQHNLTEIYKDYEAYLSGSTSEGFGLTLMEAVGSGLPIIGFDVRYGNKTFIDDGVNGVLIPIDDHMETRDKTRALADAVIKLFTEMDMETARRRSYEIAGGYLAEEVEALWKQLLG